MMPPQFLCVESNRKGSHQHCSYPTYFKTSMLIAEMQVPSQLNVQDRQPLPDLMHGSELRVYGESTYASQKDLITSRTSLVCAAVALGRTKIFRLAVPSTADLSAPSFACTCRQRRWPSKWRRSQFGHLPLALMWR